jgi:hypothetical protein
MLQVATPERVRAKPTQARYVRVNAEWPTELPALTAQEAISAAKRLFRFGMKKAWKRSIKLTSGNRYTWIRSGVLYVNPDRGWHALVHDMSHLVHYRLHPNLSGHDWRHAHLERAMVSLVVSKGWLEGTLRREPKPQPRLQDIRYARIVTRIKTWETKRKRAETALKKLRKRQAYYDKKMPEEPTS